MDKVREKVKLVACKSAEELGKKIASELGIPLAKYESRQFANSETRIVLNETVRGKRVFIVGTGFTPVNDAVMEMYLLACTCRDSGAKEITLMLPHYPYARQDKKDAPRAPVSAKYIADMFKTANVSRIVSMDLHAGAIQGFFDGPFDNLYGTIVIKPFLMEKLFKHDTNYRTKYVAVAPDAGGYKRTDIYSKLFGLPFISMEKTRDYSQENVVTKSIIHGNVDIRGKIAIIFDDICDTGGTINAAAKELREQGAIDVIVCVTHGLLSGKGLEIIASSEWISQFFCSDSVPQENRVSQCKKISVFSIAPLYAEVIRRTVNHQSNSDLFV